MVGQSGDQQALAVGKNSSSSSRVGDSGGCSKGCIMNRSETVVNQVDNLIWATVTGY